MKGSDHANCEDDVDTTLMLHNDLPRELSSEVLSDYTEDSSVTSDSTDSNSSQSKNRYRAVTLQDCSNIYFAGFLIKNIDDKYSCQNCVRLLCAGDYDILNNKRQLLIIQKTYESNFLKIGLRKPSGNLEMLTELGLKIVNRFLNKRPQTKYLTRKIKNKILKKIDIDKFINAPTCHSHIDFLLNSLVQIKIFKECKWRTTFERDPKKKARKLNILRE